MIPEEPEAYLETKKSKIFTWEESCCCELIRSTHMSYRLAPGGYERTREEKNACNFAGLYLPDKGRKAICYIYIEMPSYDMAYTRKRQPTSHLL